MSGNSLQSLSQRLAAKQASDQERIETETRNALARHEQSLSDASRAGQRSIGDATSRLTNQVRGWEDQLTEAQKATASTTARVLAQHQERLEQATADAQARTRALLARSVIPLALIWGLALTGLLVALAAGWWASRQGEQIQAGRQTLNELGGLDGVRVNRTVEGGVQIVAPPSAKAWTAQDGRAVIDLER